MTLKEMYESGRMLGECFAECDRRLEALEQRGAETDCAKLTDEVAELANAKRIVNPRAIALGGER